MPQQARKKTPSTPEKPRSPKAPRRAARGTRPAAAPNDSPLFVVGIGASAGGLEALRALFGEFKKRPEHMAFVVVQHLAPLHRSRLVELIASNTTLEVSEVREGTRPQAGMIYITPPNANILSEDGKLRLKETQAGPKPSVDTFLRSLAADHGNRAVGVVLSGTGSDGAIGMRAIKAAGGMTLCQSVETAKYDGMPKAALHTGAVDAALAPQDIARELARYNGVPPPAQTPASATRASARSASADPYDRIMGILERQAGVSFQRYKQSTIRRRMARRLAATGCESLADYAQYLEATPGEAQNLMQDILISVTSFFRDGEAFKALSQCVIERLKGKREGSHFRCWIIGCATGEEAYSLAILLSEAMDKARRHVHLQIFATDLDEQALAVARRGVYPRGSFSVLPKKLLQRYFDPLDDGFQVKASLRDCIVFARHNAAEDAPFLNLDLASCRNVLIYFNSKLQEQVFATLQYALPRGGLLFLGKSEAVPSDYPTFELINKRFKIYTRVAVKGEVPRPARLREPGREAPLPGGAREATQSPDLFNAVIAGLAPDSILVDDEFFIRHVYGEAGQWLSHPAGQATQNITRLLPADLGTELVALLRRAANSGHLAMGRKREMRGRGKTRTLQLSVAPVEVQSSRQYLVCFTSSVMAPERVPQRSRGLQRLSAEERVEQLNKELAEMREHLQTVLQEQETSNEELQSLNEELQSSNEELQSSNEELETTNEELQSANEELTTVNEELNVKTGELHSLNQRLQAIQNSIVYPLLILDRNRRLTGFNPSARQLLRISDADLNVDVKAIGSIADVPGALQLIDDAYTRRAEPRMQINIAERTFEAQVQLYRNAKNALDGVVLSLVDNTEITRALEESRLYRERLSSIMEATPAIVTMKDLTGLYVYANRRFGEMLGIDPATIVGRSDEEIFGAEASSELQEHDYAVIRKKRPLEFIENYKVGGARRIWHSCKFPLLDSRKRVQSVCAVSVDMTERLAHEQQLDLFNRAVSASNTGVLLLEPEGDDFRTHYASSQVGELTGLAEDRLLGVPLTEFMRRLRIKEKPEEIEAMLRKLRNEEEATLLVPVSRAIAGDIWLELRSRRVILKENSRPYLTITFVDVTQRVRDHRTIAAQQEELEKVGRFSALTEIAAGIAHEVNTPLSVIVTKTGILKTLAKQDRMAAFDASGVADDIARMAKSVSEIVHGLSAVVTRNADQLEQTSMQQIVRDAAKICEARFHRFGTQLRLELPAGEVSVECYPVQILQVLINLFNNAVDAVAELSERWVSVSLTSSADQVEVVVSDSGAGISPAVAEKIFTPFFSTKKDGDGTGIGLSLSRSIARRHNGELLLDASVPHTAFRLVLPRKVGTRGGAVDLLTASE